MDNVSLRDFLRYKWVRIVLIVDVLLIVLVAGLTIAKAVQSATLVLNVTPVDAQILLNGTSYANGAYTLTPGHYKVEISHEGLDKKTFELDIASNQTASVTTYLTSGGKIDFYKKRENNESFVQLQNMASPGRNVTTDQDKSAETAVGQLSTDLTAMGVLLPINDVLYENVTGGRRLVHDITIRTSYDAACETWLCVEALMLGTNDEDEIKQLMADKGLKVEDYEIRYKTY